MADLWYLDVVRAAARAHLDQAGGPGRNREAVRDLRQAVDLAAAEYEAAHASPPPPVRPGEHPSDDPVWERGACARCGGPKAAHGMPGEPCACAMPDARPCGCTDFAVVVPHFVEVAAARIGAAEEEEAGSAEG